MIPYLTTVTPVTLRILTNSLFKEHNLTGWTLQWNNNKRTLGQCDHIKRHILISRWLLRNTKESDLMAFDDTVRHEVAHAVVGIGQGHNRNWQRTAILLGAKPKASASVALVDPYADVKYVMVNTHCNKIIKPYYRKPSSNFLVSLQHRFLGRDGVNTLGKLMVFPYVSQSHVYQVTHAVR